MVTTRGSWRNLVLCITYAYAVLLVCCHLASNRRTASVHLDIVLLVSLTSYVLRDLLPFTTFTLTPKDAQQGWLLWVKILVLIVAAVVVPLTRPRLYIPVDPENPMVQPNAEQTCSLFTSLTYSYLDSLVFLAFKQGTLEFDQLPALADYDSAGHLIRKSLPILDPRSSTASKHLLYGVLKVYRQEYISLFVLAIANNLVFRFLGPVIMNRLLASLEHKQLFIRPWVWVALLFFIPLARSVVQARYTWIATRQKTQAEGIMMQLLFVHSLRIRMNSESKDSKARDRIGRLNNLSTSDVANLTDVLELWIDVLLFPLQLIFAVWFLYLILGWSSFVGLTVVLVTLPLPSYLTKLLRRFQMSSRQKTDARVQKVTETMTTLRMIKWFAWENKIKEDIAVKREEELTTIKNVRLLVVLNESINFIIPLLITVSTFSIYTLVMGQKLTASVVFTSLAVFDGILRQSIRSTLQKITVVIQGKVSLDRVDDFMRTASGTTELLDSYSVEDLQNNAPENCSKIGFQEAEFSWSSEADSSAFRLCIGSEVVFQRGVINLIVGPTGVGKTAMLLALLGEMHFTPAGSEPWVNLPRNEGVAYTSQQPWVENATIKQNIAFNSSIPFDEARYTKVLNACALCPDLELLDAGDETEVGERGLTLSGGQKARVSLARAVYSTASILLLDDIFAALDVHTAKWIIDHCLSSDLMQGRTVILVTHHIALARPVSQWVVSLGSDGSIMQGSVDEVLKSTLATTDVREEQKSLGQAKIEETYAKDLGPSRKLIAPEKSQQGMVKWSTYRLFLANVSSRPVLYLCTICALLVLNEAVTAFQYWFLGFWSSQYTDRPAASVAAPFYLGIYTVSVVLAVVFYIVAYTLCALGTMRTAKKIHEMLINAVVGTTLRWLDTTPMSRVITRITQDINKIDNNFARGAILCTELTISILAKFTAVMILSPAFILPGATITLVSVLTGRIYMNAQLPIQRQMSAARSPILAHFSAAISGLISIRAYGAEEAFLRESARRIDLFIRPAISFWNLNRQVQRLLRNVLGGLFSSALGWYLIYGGGSRYGPANVGFSLSMATSLTSMILLWVRVSNTLQLDGTPWLLAAALERVEECIDTEQEQKPTKAGIPPAYWPASGALVADNVSARYSADGPDILHNISFKIKSGERIAIVGRTGSGKSSLTLVLLRCIPTEGKVYYDDIPTDSINLDSLRSNITIIPQVPELLGGTIRRNLDPSGTHDDSVLNDALYAAGLSSLPKAGDGSGITLERVVSAEGGSMSLGERQIVALARAIVRRSKLLILDEGLLSTVQLYYHTDAIIQSTLRTELRGVTLITVAHRLQTVMDYDRVMVLDAGRIVEFDTPMNLLKGEGGYFRAMVESSHDRDTLLAMANKQV
ncbi:P-loop containing nucleoside triphosphate hydrolase protein [Mycena pura]|uniref:P-loop containing nucleoside triphosphate hydrolase protein n=1 Tax=Mycena pura TaxID=153505 RepID=A0AAD6VNT0_9AGAR|nr:P-loop containing nucleoside triphosphate hydrolase protein [Mycena pura]